MPATKTRQMFIDIARQLFAKSGVENTTMNDIAVACEKGRRTLYTYFKSKEEIYMAVVESELDILIETMSAVAAKNLSPEKKIIELIYTRLDTIKEVVYRNGSLRANFFKDILKVERVRRNFDKRETLLFRDVMREGVEKGIFHIDDIDMTADILHYCMKGIEIPYIRGKIGAHLDEAIRIEYVVDIVYGALHVNKTK